MNAISDDTMDELESAAREGAKRIKAFFAYQGAEASYERKARIGAAVIAGYSRLRASETNRAALVLAAARLNGQDASWVVEQAGLLPPPKPQS